MLAIKCAEMSKLQELLDLNPIRRTTKAPTFLLRKRVFDFIRYAVGLKQDRIKISKRQFLSHAHYSIEKDEDDCMGLKNKKH